MMLYRQQSILKPSFAINKREESLGQCTSPVRSVLSAASARERCISGFYVLPKTTWISRDEKEFKTLISFIFFFPSQYLKTFFLLRAFCVASREISEASYIVVCFVKMLSSVLCMVYRCNDVCVLYCSLIFLSFAFFPCCLGRKIYIFSYWRRK